MADRECEIRKDGMRTRRSTTFAKLRRKYRETLHRIRQNVAPGLRTILGLLLIVGGVFGFFPVLGYWMIPLGVGVVLIDVRTLFDEKEQSEDHEDPEE